jgi:hypothetical protein
MNRTAHIHTDSIALSKRNISSCSKCNVPVLPRWRAKAAAQAEWMLLTQFSNSTCTAHENDGIERGKENGKKLVYIFIFALIRHREKERERESEMMMMIMLQSTKNSWMCCDENKQQDVFLEEKCVWEWENYRL